jgi:hypothetical protein
VDAGGRRINPEKGPKLKAVMAGESDSALCTKALAGPMDRTARLVCGAKPQKPMQDARMVERPRDDETRGGQTAKRQVGPRRRKTPPPAGGSKTAKSVIKIPGALPEPEREPARPREQSDCGPGTCAEGKAITNDPTDGVSNKHNEPIRKREALKTAWANQPS